MSDPVVKEHDLQFLRRAIELALEARQDGRHPFGALIVNERGEVTVEALNNAVRPKGDPTQHAETVACAAAARMMGDAELARCTLYTSTEPCAMCAGAISHARLRRLYYAAPDPKGGAVEHGPRFFSQPTCLHAPQVYGGIRESEAAAMLRAFFAARR